MNPTNRRGFLGWLFPAAASAVALNLGPVRATPGNGEPIRGVGVLRHPDETYQDRAGGPITTARQVAEQLAPHISQGTVLVLPSAVDAWGRPKWDFRIEGGNPEQVRVERSGGSVRWQVVEGVDGLGALNGSRGIITDRGGDGPEDPIVSGGLYDGMAETLVNAHNAHCVGVG